MSGKDTMSVLGDGMKDRKISSKLWYVGTVYSFHPGGQDIAFRDAAFCANAFMRYGFTVLVPIVHGHVADVLGGLPVSHEYWVAGIDKVFMERCDGLMAVNMPGHGLSRGLNYERRYFKEAGKPVVEVDWPLTDEQMTELACKYT